MLPGCARARAEPRLLTLAKSALAMELPPVALTLAKIFGSLFAGLATLSLGLRPVTPRGRSRGAVWLPPHANASKRAGELLALTLSPLWIASLGALDLARLVRAEQGLSTIEQELSSRAASTSAGESGAT